MAGLSTAELGAAATVEPARRGALHERPRLVRAPAPRVEEPPRTSDGVCLAHDYLLVMRGAERTFAAIADLYRQAPIYTLLYDEQGTGGRFAGRSITTSPLQRLGVGQSSFRRLLPLYPRCGRAPAPARVRRRAQQQQRVRPRRAARPRARCTSATAHARFATRGTSASAALPRPRPPLRPLLRLAARAACVAGTWPPAGAWTPTSPTPSSPASASSATTVATPPSSIRRWRPPLRARQARRAAAGRLRARRATSACTSPSRRRAARARRSASSAAAPSHAALGGAYPEARFPRTRRRRGAGRAVRERPRGDRAEHGGVRDHRRRGPGRGRPVIAAARRRSARDGARRPETGLLAELDDVEAFARAIEAIDALDFDPARAVAERRALLGRRLPRRIAAQVEQARERAGSRATR